MPFDDKIKFSDQVKKLSPSLLAEFVELVKQVSAKSIKELSIKKLQLRLNDIDKESFRILFQFVDKHKATSKKDKEEMGEPPRKIAKLG